MEFPTFYSYFLYSKNWAYVLMIITLPIYVWYWNVILFPRKPKDGGHVPGDSRKD